ncbi:hypothetical protein [Paracoccus aestuariivivens]|uniref:Uncharacterized protein n=1 Tax=Paracoccus aestuariivivens TaxID=1820333 RepID=A0A6L6JBR8_9RHOB|nr:hypothetical protein [Paracoccus aestuariivivens]MTH79430.1 hypothetical protein [Paracoccus aestuariivivens]
MSEDHPSLLQRLRAYLAPTSAASLRTELIARSAAAAESRRMMEDTDGTKPVRLVSPHQTEHEVSNKGLRKNAGAPSPIPEMPRAILSDTRPSPVIDETSQAPGPRAADASEKLTVEGFEKRMSRADWHYAYADDPEARRSGRAEIAALTQGAAQLATRSHPTALQVSQIWDRMVPQDYRVSFEGYAGQRYKQLEQDAGRRDERDRSGDRER